MGSQFCTSHSSLFSFLKNISSDNFTSSFIFSFMFLFWRLSTYPNPRPKYDDRDQQTFSSFNTCKGLRFLWKLKYCQQNKNHLVTAHTSKNMICSTWLDVPFSSYMEKVICAIWLAVGFLDQLLNQIYFFPFQWVNLSMFIINSAISSG